VNVRNEWISSDRGLRQFRIVRDGCFRLAIPLPDSARPEDIRGIRAIAYERPPADGKPQVVPTPVHLTRINKIFMLSDDFLPGGSRFAWRGTATIAAGGAPFDLPIP